MQISLVLELAVVPVFVLLGTLLLIITAAILHSSFPPILCLLNRGRVPGDSLRLLKGF